MQALFEGSMYTFVFLWTPALSPGGEALPHGFIFAIFMTASLAGTAAAGQLMARMRLEQFMQVRGGWVGGGGGQRVVPALSLTVLQLQCSCFASFVLCICFTCCMAMPALRLPLSS